MPTLPEPVAAFVAANSKSKEKKVLLEGLRIPTFSNSDFELELSPRSAADAVAGEETDALDRKRHAALGFIAGYPVVVDVSKKTLPVSILLDGDLHPIAAFAALVKSVARPVKVKPPSDKDLIEPKTADGPAVADWPKGKWLLLHHSNGPKNTFMRLEPEDIRPTKLTDVYYGKARCGRSVTRSWPAAICRADKFSDRFLDVVRFDRLVAVSPRARRLLEEHPMKGVEFLPVRVTLKRQQADYYVVNPTRTVECLDRKKCEFPAPARAQVWGPDPKRLVMRDSAAPTDTWLFRPREIDWPPIIANGALAEALRRAALSGLSFESLTDWKA